MSLYENLNGCVSLVAGADLSAKQYFFVKINASGQAVLATAGDAAVGVLFDKPTSGAIGAVRPLDGRKCKVSAGGVIAKGDLIASDANGQAKTAVKATTNTSDAGAGADPLIGSNVLGVALEAAAALNDVIQFLALPLGAVATTAA